MGPLTCVQRVLGCCCKKMVHVGPGGSGHATKAINNAMNISHLLIAGEGLLALRRLGVDPTTALEVGTSSRLCVCACVCVCVCVCVRVCVCVNPVCGLMDALYS